MPPPPDLGNFALALGSSFLGVYAHAGFLRGLEEAGISPARLAGCSAGALAGALYASGLRGQDLTRAALASSLRWSFADLSILSRIPSALASLGSAGIFSGARTIRHLDRYLGQRRLDELEFPLEVAVTRIDSSEPVILSSTPAAASVMASCAVPGLFTPQTLDGQRYLDGGVCLETPFEHWLDDPAIDTIVTHRIVRPASPASIPSPRLHPFFHFRLHRHSNAEALHRLRLQRARLAGKKVVECVTVAPVPGLFTQRLAPRCHDLGLATARRLTHHPSPTQT